MAVADRHGLPIAIGIASGERHETKLVFDTLDARFVEGLPEKLIGDRACDSDGLDAQLAVRGVEMIAPHNPELRTGAQAVVLDTGALIAFERGDPRIRALVREAINDTDRPHAHIVVRGVDLDGGRVLLSPQYISHDMRWTAQELATRHLGPRLEADIRRTREREVTQERFTSLDREIQRCVQGPQTDLGAVRRQSRDELEAEDLARRPEHLERMRVAESIAGGAWQLAPGWDRRLRELGERGDIIKRMHRAMRRAVT